MEVLNPYAFLKNSFLNKRFVRTYYLFKDGYNSISYDFWDCEKKSVNKILLWYARVASLKIRLLTLVLYITVVEWHVKSRRFSARLIRPFIRYSGRRPSYIILSSPYTCAQLRIVLVHFFVASNVARYSAFNRAVSLGNTLLWRFSFR